MAPLSKDLGKPRKHCTFDGTFTTDPTGVFEEGLILVLTDRLRPGMNLDSLFLIPSALALKYLSMISI